MYLNRDDLARLIPPVCRLMDDPELSSLLQENAEAQQLAPIILRRSREARAILSVMTGLDGAVLSMLPEGAELPLLLSCLQEGLTELMHLCSQSNPGELLTVLAQCSFNPDMQALSLLVSRYREEQARQLYGLQLLWRTLRDERIPDALSLFGQTAAPTPEQVRSRLLKRMGKEAAHD